MASTGPSEAPTHGTLHFLTGGTTRQARLVPCDADRWRRVVAIKAKLLQAHGVGRQHRVAVCHPFSPWSIGQVHVEGALSCGSDVYPFGLNAHSPEILRMLAAAAPSHVCGGARYLIRLGKLAKELGLSLHLPSGGKAFVAGEPLERAVREECEALWQAPVVDVYGMAEFDSIGVELGSAGRIALVDDFEYALDEGNGHETAPSAGRSGELWIRHPGETAWHATGDRVSVAGPCGVDGFSVEVGLEGRLDHAINFSDGSAISESQVEQVARQFSPELRAFQVQVFRPPGGDIIRAVCVPRGKSLVVDFAAIRDRVINANVDIADSFDKGVIRDCIVDVYPSENVLVQTARGKRPLLVRME